MDVQINYRANQTTPVVYNFSKHYKGDTLEDINFTIQEEDPNNLGTFNPVDLTDSTIIIQFKVTAKSNTAKLVLSTEVGGGLIVTDAPNGIYQITGFVPELIAGTYLYDAQFTFIDGLVKTYHKGKIVVIQDVTRT